MNLRPYQMEALEALYAYLRERDGNPALVAPTGSGKSVLLAAICRDAVQRWKGRVLVLTHVKELLEQAAEKLRAAAPDLEIGIYSAGLGRREMDAPVILAGIQSVYRRATELGRFDLAVVDEAHRLPPDGEGMYRTFIAEARLVNPALRLIGLTATPYRTGTGDLCGPDNLLNEVCHEVGIRELIRDGYLAPVVSKAAAAECDVANVRVERGEFVSDDLEKAMDSPAIVEAAVKELVLEARGRRSCLVFCCAVSHAHHVSDELRALGEDRVAVVVGETPEAERVAAVKAFRDGKLRWLVNVNVFTEGFDVPTVDLVALLRATMSPGLYCQMVGRGLRIASGKSDCLLLDFGGNVVRHGPIDAIRVPGARSRPCSAGEPPGKTCPSCRAVIAVGYEVCPQCGHEFPPRTEARHSAKASTELPLSKVEVVRYQVLGVEYCVHRKRGADESAPKSMRVDYRVGWNHRISEWICIEHSGYAKSKAIAWWTARSKARAPLTANEAVYLAEENALAKPLAITVQHVPKELDRVIGYELGPVPEWRDRYLEEEEGTPSSEPVPAVQSSAHDDLFREVPW